ncbi:Vault protein inter-alpha-trypsin [Pseudobythopirellula maris]|uniref:Vault protein inter-alpha-trypsin n=1 Tax=Pseudobythopirellula maris TaxID=2527991 RepID=A0A5C5ZK38_9BACT|nr:VIT domain-containing protein [Pseudobythopirellula maris]TWT87485.1 Vault protein inter-alpha-trypsin [Pseudobythopirellula maris]
MLRPYLSHRLFTRSSTALLAAAIGAVACYPSTANAAGLLIADGGLGGRLEVLEHQATVTINNGVAVTEVEQVFLNTENRAVEALYVFPVPEGASVANFSMWIGGKEMVGEVVEKQRAREIYESYKATRTDPGLLEQKDYKTFEMRIFPIAAGAEQRVRISYYQELGFDADRATYTYPLSTQAQENGDSAAARLGLTVRVLSETPIVALDSPSHGDAFVVAQNSPHFYEASYETRDGDLSRDFVLSYQVNKAQTGVDLITSKPQGEDGYFMLTVTAGDELSEVNEPADYVFVLDVSGSMGFGRKLGVSRESIAAFVETLSPQDRVEVMTFNVRPTTLFGELTPASEATLSRAREFLQSQQAVGGTVLRHAMQTAYKYGEPDRQLNVVVLSDGMTEQGERSELLQLIGQRPANATVFTVGVGNEVDRPLLRQLAEDAGGIAAFLSEGDDAQRQALAFRRKLTHPAATDVRLTIDGPKVYDVTPKLLPSLYHGAPIRVYGRYRGDGPFGVRVDAEARGKPLALTATKDRGDGKNPEIERMWAQQTIAALLKDADRNDERDAVIDRIVDLAEAYSIVTEYTSFIVLENDAEYQRWKIDRRNAQRLERDRQGRDALEARLERLREESLANLGPLPTAKKPAAKKFSTSFAPAEDGANTPEPSSVLLLLLGAGPLLLGRRRRVA